MSNKAYQICTNCVMDTSDEDIVFNEEGVCNHCISFKETLREHIKPSEESKQHLNDIIHKIKHEGKNKEYDSIIGVSGGVDSCYLLYLCHQWGLKPLVLHMDNGWNSEIAVGNIKKIVKSLNFGYESYVLDWNEFKKIQLAFIKSSIVDIEMPTDLAIPAALYKTASKHNIKYNLSGGNFSGEGILPLTWGYHVLKDGYLYRHIVKNYSDVKNKKVPYIGLWKDIYYKFIKGIKTYYPLNFIDYDKDNAREFLKKEFEWKDYGGKHHESKITGFWQSYIMPTKYNMDYRRATFSSQIVYGHMNREEALEILKEKPYDEATVEQDMTYIAKKYGISLDEFKSYLDTPPKTYKDFPNQKELIQSFYNFYTKNIR